MEDTEVERRFEGAGRSSAAAIAALIWIGWATQRWRILTRESAKEVEPCVWVAEEAGPVVSVRAGEGKPRQACDVDVEGQGESDAPSFSSADS